MIKLSDMLIATLDDKDPLIALQINEAKRLEALETPRVEAKREPLVHADGDKIYVIVNERGCYVDWQFTSRDADLDARDRTEYTGKPHTVCQVMAPVDGECPTVPVVTFTPTPEKPHEWVIYLHQRHFMNRRNGQPTNFLYLAQRFPTAAEAQAYIDENDITGAYPWPVPKLTS